VALASTPPPLTTTRGIWNLHYRAALSYITGSHNFRWAATACRYHDNTTYEQPVSSTFLGSNPQASAHLVAEPSKWWWTTPGLFAG
jgi:hypothetical protein